MTLLEKTNKEICGWLEETGVLCNNTLNQVKDKCKTFFGDDIEHIDKRRIYKQSLMFKSFHKNIQ